MKLKFSRAFTLLEVLVTVAILSSAIIFLFRSFASALSAARLSQDIMFASYLSEDKLWDIEQGYRSGLALPETSSGSQQIYGKTFYWDYNITAGFQNPDLKEVQFTIHWKENAREEAYSMEFVTDISAEKNEDKNSLHSD